MQEFGIEFHKYLFITYIKTLIVLISVLGLKRVKVDISEKINYLLYNFKSVFIYFIFQLKICLCIANNSSKNVDYLSIFNSKMIMVNNKFAFNLDFLIFKD